MRGCGQAVFIYPDDDFGGLHASVLALLLIMVREQFQVNSITLALVTLVVENGLKAVGARRPLVHGN